MEAKWFIRIHIPNERARRKVIASATKGRERVVADSGPGLLLSNTQLAKLEKSRIQVIELDSRGHQLSSKPLALRELALRQKHSHG